MRAIDTNVLARYLLGDDVRQAALAADIVHAGVHVPATVLLESVWLLGSRYALSPAIIAATLTDFIDLPTVHLDDTAAVLWALDRYAAGADFADMLHVVGASPARSFATFDRGIARHAGERPPVAIETLG